jgi:hypothetical protein
MSAVYVPRQCVSYRMEIACRGSPSPFYQGEDIVAVTRSTPQMNPLSRAFPIKSV